MRQFRIIIIAYLNNKSGRKFKIMFFLLLMLQFIDINTFAQNDLNVTTNAFDNSVLNVCGDAKNFIIEITANTDVTINSVVINVPTFININDQTITVFETDGITTTQISTISFNPDNNLLTVNDVALQNNHRLKIYYYITASCGIIPLISVTDNNYNTATVNYTKLNSYTITETTHNTYSIAYGVISLDMTLYQTMFVDYDPSSPILYSRQFTISNSQGTGAVKDLKLIIEYENNSMDLISLEVVTDPSVIIQIPDPVFIGEGKRYEISVGDFPQGYQIELEEKFEIVGCSAGITNITYSAEWGCNGDLCNQIEEIMYGNPTASASVQQITKPNNIEVEFDNFSYCNAPTGESSFDIFVRNTATDSYNWAEDLEIRLYKYSSQITINSIEATYTTITNNITSSINTSNTTNNIVPLIQLANLSSDNKDNDLAPGQFVKLHVKYNYVCQSIISCSSVHDQVSINVKYNTKCGYSNDEVYAYVYQYENNSNSSCSGTNEVVATNEPNSYSFSFLPNIWSSPLIFLPECTSKNYWVEVELPAGYSISSAFYQSQLNVNQTSVQPNTWVLSGGPIYTLEPNTSFIITVTTNCSEIQDGFAKIYWRLNYKCDDNSCSCARVLACDDFLIYTSNLCSTEGELACLNLESFNFSRTTYGWVQNSDPFKFETTIGARANKATAEEFFNLNRAYVYDNVEAEITGSVSSSCSLSVVKAVINYVTSNSNIQTALFGPISATFSINDGTAVPADDPVYLTEIISDLVVSHKLIYSLTTNVAQGSSISFNASLQVNDNMNAGDYIDIPFVKAYIEGDGIQSNYGNGNGFKIFKPGLHVAQSGIDLGCTYKYTVNFKPFNTFSGLLFPNEFRPIALPKSILFPLMNDYVYEEGSAKFYFDNANNNVAVNNPPATPLNSIKTFSSNNPLNEWPLIERKISNNQPLIFQFNAKPSCTTIINTPIMYSGEVKYNQYCYLDNCPVVSCEIPVLFSTHNPHDYIPELNVSAFKNQFVENGEATWTINIQNTGTGSSENTWLMLYPSGSNVADIVFDNAFSNTGNVTTTYPIEVIDINQIGNEKYLVKLGSIPAGADINIYVKAQISGCSGDHDIIDDIALYYGGNCAPYPTSLDISNPCAQQYDDLTLTHPNYGLEFETISPISSSNICQPIDYRIIVYNKGRANLSDIKLWLELTPGVSIVSSQYTYMDSPVNFPPNYTGFDGWDFSSVISPFTGIPPSQSSTYPIIIDFTLMTTCDNDFDPILPIKVKASYNNPCNIMQIWDNPGEYIQLNMSGIINMALVPINITATDIVSLGDLSHIEVNLPNGNNGVSSGEIVVSFPSTVEYIQGSFTPEDPNLETTGGGLTKLSWPLSTTVDPYTIKFDIKDTPPLVQSAQINISAEVMTDLSLTCTVEHDCNFHGTVSYDNTLINVPVPAPCNLTITAAHTNATCECNATMHVSVTGGNPPYTYAWNHTTETTSALIHVCSSITPYHVVVTDMAGCLADGTIDVVNTSSIGADVLSTNESCSGACDGTATITNLQGTSPFTFSWSINSAESSESSVSNLCSANNIPSLGNGLYNVSITDGNGCTTLENVSILADGVKCCTINATAQILNPTCNPDGFDGEIYLTITNGSSPYTFEWSFGGFDTEDITGLCAGTYYVTIADDSACTLVKQFTLTNFSFSPLFSVVDESCTGEHDGSITVSVLGGVAPYSYLWSNGSTIKDRYNIQSGHYDITIIDANGCEIHSGVDVDLESEKCCKLIVVANSTDAKCECTGTINLVPTGDYISPIVYSWSNSSFASLPNLINVCAGKYSVTATDAEGCSSSTNVTINNPGAPTITSIIKDESCPEKADGEINLIVSDGSSPYTFLWSNGAVSEDINGLSSGNYSVTVIDDRGCVNTYTCFVGLLSNTCTELNCEDCLASFRPIHGVRYAMSVWVKESNCESDSFYANPQIMLYFPGAVQALQVQEFSTSPEDIIIDGWQRMYSEFVVPDNAIKIFVYLKNKGNNTVYFDDVRIHPFNGNMKSFVYDPISLKVSAELDENNYATFYEYDEEGTLIRIKKETARGVMTIKESVNHTSKKDAPQNP